ncbi:hypothetical protein PT274_03550 [Leuconostocaceae bacterium ESL0958]|nr:hypothetical protein [Leuconostocaceae bacterium ESL0958]
MKKVQLPLAVGLLSGLLTQILIPSSWHFWTAMLFSALIGLVLGVGAVFFEKAYRKQ